MSDIIYFLLNGTATNNPKDSDFYLTYYENQIIFPGHEIISKIDMLLAECYLIVANNIFNNIDDYYKILQSSSLWMNELGYNPESGSSNVDFEKLIKSISNPDIFKLLYVYDIHFILSSLQKKILNTKIQFCNFYKSLSELIPPLKFTENGTFILISEQTINIYSIVEYIFISFGSILDVITKFVYEIENLKNSFNCYQRLSSNNITYGDKKLLKINKNNTIFEDHDIIKLLLNIRNEIIHNASWDQHNSIFYEINNNEILSRYLLFPDFKDGNIIKVVNRNRFFSKNHTINDMLPIMCKELWDRIKYTIQAI